jgi:hypothetical protein
MEDDRSYYSRRAEAESRAAATAPDAEARRRHLELAEMLRVKSLLNAPRSSATLLK